MPLYLLIGCASGVCLFIGLFACLPMYLLFNRCLGPTQHLKAKFGSGYLLEVKLGGGSSASREALEERMEVLEQHLITVFPNATCLESFAERAQYKIPQSDVTALSAVFAALESSKFDRVVSVRVCVCVCVCMCVSVTSHVMPVCGTLQLCVVLVSVCLSV